MALVKSLALDFRNEQQQLEGEAVAEKAAKAKSKKRKRPKKRGSKHLNSKMNSHMNNIVMTIPDYGKGLQDGVKQAPIAGQHMHYSVC